MSYFAFSIMTGLEVIMENPFNLLLYKYILI